MFAKNVILENGVIKARSVKIEGCKGGDIFFHSVSLTITGGIGLVKKKRCKMYAVGEFKVVLKIYDNSKPVINQTTFVLKRNNETVFSRTYDKSGETHIEIIYDTVQKFLSCFHI